jgi:hypothetical protein
VDVEAATARLYSVRAAFATEACCLVPLKIPSFFTLSITLIFSRLHKVLNIGKKITNYIV